MTAGAPLDCYSCKTFYFDKEGEIVRPRLVGEEITDRNCSTCPFLLVEYGTFKPSGYTLTMIQRYLLWQRMGISPPKSVKDADAFAQLGKLEKDMNAGY